jgi:hypothetical protein
VAAVFPRLLILTSDPKASRASRPLLTQETSALFLLVRPFQG